MNSIPTVQARRTRRRRCRRRGPVPPRPKLRAGQAEQVTASLPAPRYVIADMTRQEIMSALAELGIEHSVRARHAELSAQLWAASMAGNSIDGDGE